MKKKKKKKAAAASCHWTPEKEAEGVNQGWMLMQQCVRLHAFVSSGAVSLQQNLLMQGPVTHLCLPPRRPDVGGWWRCASLPRTRRSDPRPCRRWRSPDPRRCRRCDCESSCVWEREREREQHNTRLKKQKMATKRTTCGGCGCLPRHNKRKMTSKELNWTTSSGFTQMHESWPEIIVLRFPLTFSARWSLSLIMSSAINFLHTTFTDTAKWKLHKFKVYGSLCKTISCLWPELHGRWQQRRHIVNFLLLINTRCQGQPEFLKMLEILRKINK